MPAGSDQERRATGGCMKTKFTMGDFSGVQAALDSAIVQGIAFTPAQRHIIMDALSSVFNNPRFIKKLGEAIEEVRQS
jgi:hypothetical protein